MEDSENGFRGVIGRTVAESTPWWPSPPIPPEGSPNVVTILLDDTGFSHLGCYGSTIETPHVDRLAAGGLRFTNFHTTALCSPTRASLLTGRNHHSVGMRGLSNWNSGFPNCTGSITNRAATLAEVLRAQGYNTFATGKWHLAPMDETSGAGPFDQWPLGRGFDRYYGFLQGETDQFSPELYCDNHPIDPPRTAAEGYHLSEDIVDQSMQMIRDQKSLVPEKPFFLYLCFGATHAPHQAPTAYLDKYRGRFDEGWDVLREQWFARQQELGIVPEGTELAPRNPGVRPWAELSTDEARLALRLQEAFAAFLDHTDAQIGRLVAFLDELGELEDTLIFLLSDNGASQEGGPIGVLDTMKWFNGTPESLEESVARLDEIGRPGSNANYPWGWAQVGNTPLKRYKQNTHGGGVRDPLVVHWPAGISDRGGIRRQFAHVVDLVPTVLEIVGASAPEVHAGVPQMPVHGTSLRYAFLPEGADAPTAKTTQHFEMFGHRGIWSDGWKAVAYHEKGTPFDDDRWELYHVDEDFSECHDLADAQPEKLAEMVGLWWAEAERFGVLPLDERGGELFGGAPKPRSPRDRRRYVYHPPVSHVNSDAAPALGSRSFTISAEIERPEATTEGVLVAYGARTSGFCLYIQGGHLVFDYNLYGHHHQVRSEVAVPVGSSVVAVRFTRDPGKGATATVTVDGEEAGSVEVPGVLRMISALGMDVGRDAGSPVTDGYEAPFPFTGSIRRLVFDVPRRRPPGEEPVLGEAEARAELSRQ